MKICTASGIVSRDLARALELDLEHDRAAARRVWRSSSERSVP